MSKIVVFGISHKTSPIEERERISFGDGFCVAGALRALMSEPSVNECAIVSTCNRVEIYAACENGERCFDEISEFLCEFNGGLRRDFIEEKFYFLEEIDAVTHIYRVAAGMDSMVVGEPQILGQLKRAYETALKSRTVGTVLNKLFQTSFSTVKRIKNKSGIGSHTVSVSSVAVGLARNIFGDIEKCSVMVVGTGEAAAEAAAHLAKRGAGEIRITGRNDKDVAKLASSLGASAVRMGEISLWLRKTDILISATGSSTYILKAADVRDAMKLRKNKPISFIDIAFPRDIDPKVRDIEGAFLYDMDSLQKIVDKNRDSLRKSLDEAEEMIKKSGERFIAWQEGLKAFPVIVELRKKVGEIVREETLKAIARIDSLEEAGNCGKEKRDEALWSLSHRTMEKFLHKPVTGLKREAANSSLQQGAYTDVVRNLFGLSGENFQDMSEDEDQNRKQR